MKSEHRHQLGTNALAKRLDVAIERFRPYASTIAGIVLAVVIAMFVWTYLAGSSSARQSGAWDIYNRSVAASPPNLEQLRLAAQDHPGTKMQQMADVTWADGQVFTASQNYIYNRANAMEALTRATSAYQGVIQSSNDERLVSRAQLGLARIYEMQGNLAEAREAYLKVKGAYAEYAKRQAERLASPDTKETYAWLATARPPLPRAPIGPGTPGKTPEFSEGELAMPGGATGTGLPASTPAQGESIEELLKGLELDFGSEGADDRYAPAGSTPIGDGKPAETDTENLPAVRASEENAPATGQTSSDEPTSSEPVPGSPASDKPSE
jgi:tetratricopeptide (TPR) repeat protein